MKLFKPHFSHIMLWNGASMVWSITHYPLFHYIL